MLFNIRNSQANILAPQNESSIERKKGEMDELDRMLFENQNEELNDRSPETYRTQTEIKSIPELLALFGAKIVPITLI